MAIEEKRKMYLEFKKNLEDAVNENFISSQMYNLAKLQYNLSNYEYGLGISKCSDSYLNLLEFCGENIYNLKELAENNDFVIETSSSNGFKTFSIKLDSYSTEFTLFKDSIIIKNKEKEFDLDKETTTTINLLNINNESLIYSEENGKVDYNSIKDNVENSFDKIINVEIYHAKMNKLIYGSYEKSFIQHGKKTQCKTLFTDFWDKNKNTYYSCMQKDKDIKPIIKNAGENLSIITLDEWFKKRVSKKQRESDWEFTLSNKPYEFQLLNNYKKLEFSCKENIKNLNLVKGKY